MELRFHSKDELIAFFAERNAEASKLSLENGGPVNKQPLGRARGPGYQEKPK